MLYLLKSLKESQSLIVNMLFDSVRIQFLGLVLVLAKSSSLQKIPSSLSESVHFSLSSFSVAVFTPCSIPLIAVNIIAISVRLALEQPMPLLFLPHNVY